MYTKDFFIRNKKRFAKLTRIFTILSVIFLPLTIAIGAKLNAIHPKYQEVSVKVISVYDAKFGNDVYVRYNDQEYKVINVKDDEFFLYESSLDLNRPVEVLLGEDGRLYSNTDGIRNETLTGHLYFLFLAFTLISIPTALLSYSCVVEAKKREKLLENTPI